MAAADPAVWLVLVAAAHLGFQLTVDLVVYPALAEVGPDAWARAHEGHSRRIAPLVGLVYVPLVLVLGWTVTAEPRDAGTWLALAGGALAVLTTATRAAPLHGRLGRATTAGRPELLRALARADRVRTAGAVLCLLGAVLLAS